VKNRYVERLPYQKPQAAASGETFRHRDRLRLAGRSRFERSARIDLLRPLASDCFAGSKAGRPRL